jgi:hypothetical protein
MADPAGLPNDIEELKRLVVLRTAERDAAKAGLLLKTLEAEKLNAQIARLKRISFGASSERVSPRVGAARTQARRGSKPISPCAWSGQCSSRLSCAASAR